MEEDGLDGALVGVLVKKSFLVRCVVCLSLGCMCDDVVFLGICARVGIGERVRAGVLCLRW